MISVLPCFINLLNDRFDVLEPKIYNSDARQVPKSPEWFMSASSKIKVLAKNLSRAALVAEEATKYLAKRYHISLIVKGIVVVVSISSYLHQRAAASSYSAFIQNGCSDQA